MNRVILIGRLTKDPETRFTQSSMAVTSFSIAVDRKYKKDGEVTADFFNVTAWGKTAEFVGKYFNKGVRIAVEGRLTNSDWIDKETNQKRYKTEVTAESVYFADGKEKTGERTEANNNLENVDEELPF